MTGRTIRRHLNEGKWHKKYVRAAPSLKDFNITERNEWTAVIFSGRPSDRHKFWIDTADYDGKYYPPPGYSGKVRFHPSSPIKEDDPDLNKTCHSKRFLPKVMIGCAVTRPKWNRALKARDPVHNGKVGI